MKRPMLKAVSAIALLIGIAFLLCKVSFAKEPLKSPWDLHSVTPTDVPYECSTAPQLPHDFATNSYYTDSRHSIPDPVLKKRYEDSVAGVENFTRDVVRAADHYQTTGSRAAASCAVTLLESAAKQKTLTGTMDGHQAFYVQGWNLGAWAVAYLKVRHAEAMPDTRDIQSWLKKLANDNRGYYQDKRNKPHPDDSDNNHLYWAGFSIAAAGIANDDRGLFNWGLDAYKYGISEIKPDGTLPNEMARGQMALHYHLYALAPLMVLAEFGEANGLDLYAERDYSIKRLIARCVSGLQDPTFFQQVTGVQQVTDAEVQAWQISWAQAYTRRFPDPTISALMARAKWLNYTMLGGLPPP